MKAYIAGPDVFYPNARELADQAKELGKKYGIEALIPIDNEVKGDSPQELSVNIFEANVKMINSADIVVANISPFRGPSADAGTVWEIGYAYGKGKPVYGFSTDLRDYKTRVGDADDGNLVEDFKNVDNLMIAHALVSVHETLEQAYAAAAASKT